MFSRNLIVRLIAFLVVTAFLAVLPGSGQQTSRTDGSWLDRPLTNWNTGAASVPRAPSRGSNPIGGGRCRESVRQTETAVNRALVAQGWVPYGPVQMFGPVTVVMALSGVDGMCRPTGYQAFVFRSGRFAGTLSPRAMNSREDGSLTEIRLFSPTGISAEFVRYTDADPLCCPSRTSSVVYDIGGGAGSVVSAKSVNTETTCQPGQSSGGGPGSSSSEADLFDRQWRLTAVNGSAIAAGQSYIQFERDRGRFTGNTGCNLMSGQYEASGDQLKLSQVISTRRACVDPNISRVEADFTRALESVTRYEVSGNNLRLFADGQEVLTFISE